MKEYLDEDVVWTMIMMAMDVCDDEWLVIMKKDTGQYMMNMGY